MSLNELLSKSLTLNVYLFNIFYQAIIILCISFNS